MSRGPNPPPAGPALTAVVIGGPLWAHHLDRSRQPGLGTVEFEEQGTNIAPRDIPAVLVPDLDLDLDQRRDWPNFGLTPI
ncbi:hypothetical protein [Streptomyces sp. NPDC001828]|uniref:hypothetical protein n=1 Tax=Streptomyces sp. NPDC001828 TaxID=3364615 RepID=UPI00368EDF18